MNLEQINAEILSLGRPTLENLRHAIDLKRMSELRATKAAWDAAHPDKASRWFALAELAGEIQRKEENAARNGAMRAGDLERIRKCAGDRVADNLEAPRDEPAMDAARAWLGTDEWCLALIGKVGNGKTFAAAWVALNAGLRPLVWLAAPEAASRSLFGAEASANAERASKAGLLVIDDFGAELASAGWKSWLEAVLGNRYSRRLRTILTSNLDKASFAARLEARLTDRIREGRVFESSGKSLRTRGGR